MSFIGNGERGEKEKALRRHNVYKRSSNPIENLSRVEDAMEMVNGMREESGIVMKQAAINKVVDPSYTSRPNNNHHDSHKMIFVPEDLNNGLVDSYFYSEQNDTNFIKSLSYKEKKRLLRELERMESDDKQAEVQPSHHDSERSSSSPEKISKKRRRMAPKKRQQSSSSSPSRRLSCRHSKKRRPRSNSSDRNEARKSRPHRIRRRSSS